MKVLLIEDDEDKTSDILSLLSDRFGVDHVPTAKSLQSGLRAVLEGEYDLVLLDMTMRNFDRTVSEDGGRPHPFAGREILRQMKRESVNFPVIVVTHFSRFGDEAEHMTLEELKGELRGRFSNYIETVQYRGNVDEWRDELAGLIERNIVMSNRS